MDYLKHMIRHVPDFPKPGILFYDITTLLQDKRGFHEAIGSLSGPFLDAGIDLVVGIESRGFIFGSAVADRLGAGFAPVRKIGKLPSKTLRASYDLEYGADALEIPGRHFARSVFDGSLPIFGPARIRRRAGQPRLSRKMKPRLSIPTTRSMPASRKSRTEPMTRGTPVYPAAAW